MAATWRPPHVTDKILNHQGGTISGVAAVYHTDFPIRVRRTIPARPHVVDETTGEIHVCQLFVAVPRHLHFTYVEATFNERSVFVYWIARTCGP